MTKRHTQGEWELVYEDYEWRIRVDDDFGEYVIARDIGGQVHKDEDGEYSDYSEVEANAHLLWTAPDLLENLIGCMEALASHAPDCIEIECARKAIAKARGEPC